MERALELLKKYGTCPECGNKKIGNGKGVLDIDINTFKRTCKCGFEVFIEDEGREEYMKKYPYLAWCNKYGMWSDSVKELIDEENDCDGVCEDCEFSDWGNDAEEDKEKYEEL